MTLTPSEIGKRYRDRALAYLLQRGEWVSSAELAKKLGCGPTRIGSMLSPLLMQKRVAQRAVSGVKDGRQYRHKEWRATDG